MAASFGEQFPGKIEKMLGHEATSFHGVGIKIEGNTLSVSTGDCFMQISNITHVRSGLIMKTTTQPNALMGFILVVAIVISIIVFVIGSSFTWPLIIGIVIGSLILIGIVNHYMTRVTNHYGLMIGLNCNLVYSFMSVNDTVVNEAYSFLKEAIDAESFTGSRTFNFGALPSAIPDTTPKPADDYHEKPAPAPLPNQLIEELTLSLEDVRYTNELSDQYRNQLYNILMDAKEGVEYASPADIERSRTAFREFARTRESWPNLFNVLWTRSKLVAFFRGES